MPLAVMNTKQATLDFQPYNFGNVAKQAAVNALMQRLKYITYMRSEIYRLYMYGGALVTPLFAHPGFTEEVQAARDLSSVMYGQAIKVDFMFKQFTSMKEVIFPAGSQWVNLNTFETLTAPKDSPLSRMFHTGLDKDVNMFQKTGTIVMQQDSKAAEVRKVEDLREVPLTLSVALDGAQTAAGNVLIEAGPLSDNQFEYFNLTAAAGKLTFSKIPGVGSETPLTVNMTQIQQIILTFVNTPVNAACALYIEEGGVKNVQILYVSTYNYQDRQQVTIQPKAIPDAGQTIKDLRLNQAKFVAYGVVSDPEKAKDFCYQ